MIDWLALIGQALRVLEADKVFCRGAKLRAQVDALGRDMGGDLQSYLGEQGLKFGQLVEQVPGVVVHRRLGTDMFVGFEGAAWPDEAQTESLPPQRARIRLREDVYMALTRVSARPYYYVPGRDEFTQDTSGLEPKVRMPDANLDDLIAERREFAQQQTDPDSRQVLLSMLDRSANPLGDFQRTVSQLRLNREWHSFKLARLIEKLERWARDSDLSVSPAWFVEPGHIAPESPQQVLARFSQFMTHDEVRSIQVPFRAVEAMYSAISRHRTQ